LEEIKMKPMDYRKKLGLSVDDKEKASRFYAKTHNYIVSASSVEFDDVIEDIFCNNVGIKVIVRDSFEISIWNQPNGLQKAWPYFQELEANAMELLFRWVELINSYIGKQRKKIRECLKTVLLNILEDCQIPYDIFNDQDGIFIFPKGAKELDCALVSQPLDWLSAYPKAHNAFVKALRKYADASQDNASDVADLFRKALETFFQEFFGKTQSLENLKSVYGAYMKARGIPAEISNNFETLHQSYTNFMNGYAKHHDKTSKNVLEYIMYQTGNIIRLLITLKAEEADNAD